MERKRPGAHVLCLSFSAGGVFLAVGSSDNYLRVYHVAAPAGPTKILEIEEHSDHVDSMQFSNHSTRFLSGSRDGVARIWYYERQSWKNIALKMSQRLPGQAVSSADAAELLRKLRVSMVGWNCDDSLVVTSVNDNSILVWEAARGQLRHVLYGHEQEVFVLECHPLDPRLMLSGGHDGAIILWDLMAGTPIKTFFNGINGQGHGAIFDAKFNADGSMFVSTDSHGHLSLFGLATSRAYEPIPEQMFFHTDYRPLARDAAHYVIDEQTQIAPHLMPPAFLVDIDGNPYEPEVQRLVPGRENCAHHQLVPLVSNNENGGGDREQARQEQWQPMPPPPGAQQNEEGQQLLDQRIEAMQRHQDARAGQQAGGGGGGEPQQQGPQQQPGPQQQAQAGDNLGGARDRRNGDVEGVLQMPAFYGAGGVLRPNWQRKPIVPPLGEQTVAVQAARQRVLAAHEEEYYASERRKRAEVSDLKLLKEIAARERLTRSKKRVVVQRRGVRVPPPPRPGELEAIGGAAALDDLHLLSEDDEENDLDYSANSRSATSESESDDEWGVAAGAVGGSGSRRINGEADAPGGQLMNTREARLRARNMVATFENALLRERRNAEEEERPVRPRRVRRVPNRMDEEMEHFRRQRRRRRRMDGEEESDDDDEDELVGRGGRRITRTTAAAATRGHRLGGGRRPNRNNGHRPRDQPSSSAAAAAAASTSAAAAAQAQESSTEEEEDDDHHQQEDSEEEDDEEHRARRRAQLAELASVTRARREAHFASITDLPEAFRPPEWLTDVRPRRTPYFPQVGDEVVYFRSGHQQYLNAVKAKNIYRLNPAVKPFKMKGCDNDEIFARVEEVAFNIRAGCGVRVATLKMVVVDPLNEEEPDTGVRFT